MLSINADNLLARPFWERTEELSINPDNLLPPPFWECTEELRREILEFLEFSCLEWRNNVTIAVTAQHQWQFDTFRFWKSHRSYRLEVEASYPHTIHNEECIREYVTFTTLRYTKQFPVDFVVLIRCVRIIDSETARSLTARPTLIQGAILS